MSSSRTVDLRGPVARRRRVHRGTWAAHVVVLIATMDALMWPMDLVRAVGPALVIGLLSAVVGVALAIRVGRLRQGDAVAARITLGACAWLVVAVPLAACDTMAGAPDLAWSHGVVGFLTGLGNTIYDYGAVADYPAAGWLLIIPLFRWIKASRPWRHPVWLFFGVFVAVAVALNVIKQCNEAGVPAWLFLSLVVLVPSVVAASRTAIGALGPPAPGTEWENSGPRQKRRLFTGRQPIRVILLLSASVVLCPLGLVVGRSSWLPIPDDVLNNPDRASALTDYVYVTFAIGAGLLWVGVAAYVRARRHALLSSRQLRTLDGRATILYLRSFRDESLRIPAHGKGRRSLIERVLGRRTDRFEEIIVWHLWKFGPVIGVGRPGDRVSPLGAAREYLPDDVWRSHVNEQMNLAALIVVQIGRSAGLQWEVTRLQEVGVSGKALFVVPPVGELERRRRWTEFRTVAVVAGWPAPPETVDPHVLAYRFVDGSWVGYLGAHLDEWNYEIAIEATVAEVERPTMSAA